MADGFDINSSIEFVSEADGIRVLARVAHVHVTVHDSDSDSSQNLCALLKSGQ